MSSGVLHCGWRGSEKLSFGVTSTVRKGLRPSLADACKAGGWVAACCCGPSWVNVGALRGAGDFSRVVMRWSCFSRPERRGGGGGHSKPILSKCHGEQKGWLRYPRAHGAGTPAGAPLTGRCRRACPPRTTPGCTCGATPHASAPQCPGGRQQPLGTRVSAVRVARKRAGRGGPRGEFGGDIARTLQ